MAWIARLQQVLGRRLATMLPDRASRQLVKTMCADDAKRSLLVDVLLHHIKDQAPPVDEMPFDLPVDGGLDFEHLTGLFAGTPLDEYIITMNLRQTGYLFGLIRRMNATKVIEVGRHWGGTSVVIAAAMRGQGRFWSIGDPRLLQAYLHQRGRILPRPIEDQLAEICRRLGLTVEILVGDPREVDVDTGEVDLVFIDGDHAYEAAKSDFERFGKRVRVGGAVLFDDAVTDPFFEPSHTEGVKRLARELDQRPDFRRVKGVRRMVHYERTA